MCLSFSPATTPSASSGVGTLPLPLASPCAETLQGKMPWIPVAPVVLVLWVCGLAGKPGRNGRRSRSPGPRVSAPSVYPENPLNHRLLPNPGASDWFHPEEAERLEHDRYRTLRVCTSCRPVPGNNRTYSAQALSPPPPAQALGSFCCQHSHPSCRSQLLETAPPIRSWRKATPQVTAKAAKSQRWKPGRGRTGIWLTTAELSQAGIKSHKQRHTLTKARHNR